MIAVSGYARDNANRNKHDDLLQVGSGFCLLCRYRRYTFSVEARAQKAYEVLFPTSRNVLVIA